MTTFERSKFVKADGTVAIGPGGGTVEGAGGVELRIPSGALENGAELKVEGLSAETLLQQFPGQVPDLGRDADEKPLAHLAGGIRITSKDEPSFTKPIDLAFPLPDFTEVPEAERPPSGKPEDAYYYVVRRLEGPCADGSDTCAAADRKVLFQTIDHGFAECPEGKTTCEASEKKVVTASWPFSGYVDSFGGFGFPSASLLIQPVAVSYAYLMWTYDQTLPGQALAGVVTGKVLRTKWNPGATTPQYEGVKGALVSAVDASGQRLLAGSEQSAITREDGSFTMWDSRYVGGTVRVAATLPGVGGDVATLCPPGDGGDASVRCGTAYEADPADWKTSGLRFHRNIATVNLTFPAVQPPPPPPAIGVVVYRVVDGQREDTRGIVPAGTPLILGVKPSSQAVEVREVQVQGAAQSFRSDPLKGQPTGADWIVEYTPGTVGTYRVEVTGLGASAEGTAEAVKGGTTFRVIGAGGTDEIVEGARPEVIPARTVPKSGATGVQVSTYVQVVFTEPVRKVSGNVLLRKVVPTTPPSFSDPIAVKLSGVLRHGGVVEDLAASPDAVVTSLTVQPLSGLEYGATYRLELGDGIEDLDTTPCGPAPNQPPPCKLVPYDTQFTTFTPESLSTNPESFGSPGIVVLEERAYLVQNHFYAGTLRVFETADPVSPLEIPNSEADSRDPRYTVSYRPVDLVGETDSPLTGGRVVAVVTGSTAQSKPSNVWVLDVNDDAATQWIGAVSLTSSAQEGFVSRSFLRAGVLYAATFRKGIQVVDLGKVKDAFKPVETDATGHFQMRQAFLTDGQGYGQEDVVGIPVSSPFGGPARLNDIEAALTQTSDGAQVLVAAPGDPGLTVVNPNTQSVLWNDKVTVEREVGGQKVVEATLRYGQAIALGNVAGQDLAVVVGSGTILQETQSRPLLMVVSLYDPQNPVGLGYVPLEDGTVGDVILKDDLALLGGSKQVTLVSLTDKTRPKVLGTAQGVGGRLALGENGSILFGTERSVFGGTNLPLGGVRTAVLGSFAQIQKVVPVIVPVGADGKTTEPVAVTYRLIAPPEQLGDLRLQLTRGADTLVTMPLTELREGVFTTTIPAGFDLSPPGDLIHIQPVGAAGPGPEYFVSVQPPEQTTGGTQVFVMRPDFASLTPKAVAPGTSAPLTIKGTNLGLVDHVAVRDGAGKWTTLPVSAANRTATSVQVTIPVALATPGVLVVSPDDDQSHGLALLVGETLPTPGTAAGVTINAVNPAELGFGGGIIELSGEGLASAGSVVIVRKGRGVRLAIEAESASDTIVSAQLPDSYVGWADDLAVGVLTADGGGLSNVLPVKSTVAEPTIDYTDIVPPGGALITEVQGPIVWGTNTSAPPQEIKIEGIGIGVGTEFILSSARRPSYRVVADTDPPPQHPTVPPSSIVTIRVPPPLTMLALNCLSLQSAQSRLIGIGGTTCLGALAPVEVPLGGRKKIAAYRQEGNDRIYLVPLPDPQAGDPATTCPAAARTTSAAPPLQPATAGVKRLTKPQPSSVTFQLSAPSVANAADPGNKLARVPLVSEEGNCFDPDQDPTTRQGAFYLRGVRLSSPGEAATVTATVVDPGALAPIDTVSLPLKVTVGRASLGAPLKGREIEDAVVDAASKTGVPPQFLKAQIKHENGFVQDTVYRYEPLTQDFLNLGRDGATGRGDPYFQRHMFAGKAASGDTIMPCVALVGPGVDLAAVKQVCSKTVPVAAGTTVVDVGETGIVRARSGAKTFEPIYRSGYPSAELMWQPPPDFMGPPPRASGPLDYKDPAYFSWKTKEVTPNLGDRSFQYDYLNNKVKLTLYAGEWVKFVYRRMTDPVPVPLGGQDGECAARLKAKAGGLAFLERKAMCWESANPIYQDFSSSGPQPTIAEWFNMNASLQGRCRGHRWLNGTDSETALEFLVLNGKATGQVLDRRLEQATAQFLAAGSFGLLQFTPSRWQKADADVLNHVFDVKTDKCVWELADAANADRIIEVCRSNRHHERSKGGRSEPVMKERRRDGRRRAVLVRLSSSTMSSSRLSGRPFAKAALQWPQTRSSGLRSGA